MREELRELVRLYLAIKRVEEGRGNERERTGNALHKVRA